MIIFLCFCRADFGETEVASCDERHEAGFSFSFLVSVITAGLIETCSRTFITSVRFDYLFLSSAELSLSTCQMEGWMNNKAWATKNSSCLLRSLRATSWPVWMFRRPGALGKTTFSRQILVFTFLEVPVCWSGSNTRVCVRADRCLLNSTRLFREVSVRFGSADSARKPFSPTPTHGRRVPLSHFWPTFHRFAAPFYCCFHRVLSSGPRLSQHYKACYIPELQPACTSARRTVSSHWDPPRLHAEQARCTAIDIMWAA